MNFIASAHNQSAAFAQQIMSQGVMVVEDSAAQLSAAVNILKQLGIPLIHQAHHGQDALNKLHQLAVRPAVIVADLQMPMMDGIELIQILAETYPDIAIIFASSADNKLLDTLGSLMDACNMTMLGALAKPLTEQKLSASLQRYVPPSPAQPHRNEVLAASDLKRAIRLGHIIPYYQPKICLGTGAVSGYEALARWRDPIKGIIPPIKFIELAAHNDLLKDLTLSLLDSVLADMVAWNYLEMFPITSINIAITLFEDKNIANQIIRAVTNANVAPKQILFEITESALMKDKAVALATIGRLKLKGFGFSIDDYGTGFSSMQQLARIAFNELKIDRSFVRAAIGNGHMTNILQSAIEMGRRLELTTVAEGVESQEELDLLKKLGCNEIQGFFFAHPMPVGDILPWLQENSAQIKKLCL